MITCHSLIYQSYIAASLIIQEPTKYIEIVKDQKWTKAMQVEIQALEANRK